MRTQSCWLVGWCTPASREGAAVALCSIAILIPILARARQLLKPPTVAAGW